MSEPENEAGRPGHGGPPRPLAGIPVPGLSGITERPKRLPFYGNYCGRGHGDPTYQTPPVDAVDAACREHNRCYALLGDYDEGCDRDFVEILPTAISETPSQAGKNAGLLALAYFSLAEPNLGLGRTLFKGASPRGGEGTKTRGGDAVSEGTRQQQAQGPQGGRSGEESNEGYSWSDSNTNTVEEDRGPKGLLAPLLNLDILPSPNSDTTTLESGDSDDFQGPAGGGGGEGRG
ncbi:MAG TPA: hypothetical protein VGV91_09730 [Rubrobacter sp.]|nr:hypothetical protein [Rubrobacter sp.]